MLRLSEPIVLLFLISGTKRRAEQPRSSRASSSSSSSSSSNSSSSSSSNATDSDSDIDNPPKRRKSRNLSPESDVSVLIGNNLQYLLIIIISPSIIHESSVFSHTVYISILIMLNYIQNTVAISFYYTQLFCTISKLEVSLLSIAIW